MKAKFIGVTFARGNKKHRWECPICRSNPNAFECRFNLSPKKDGTKHKCRFCKTILDIKK